MTRNKWGIALASALIHLGVGGIYGWSILVKPIVNACGFSITATTFIFSIGIFFLGCGAATFGKYIDNIGASKVGKYVSATLLIGYLISALAIYTNSIILLYIGYGGLVGICTGASYVLPIGTLAKYFPNRVGLVGAICISSFGLAASIMSPLMMFIIDTFGLIVNFIVLGVLFSLTILLSSSYLAPPKDYEIIRESNLVDALSPKAVYNTWQFKSLFVSFAFNIGAGIALLALIALMLQDDFGFTPLDATAFVALCGIANASGRFIWANLSDLIGCPNMYVFYALVGTICYSCIAFSNNLYLFEISVLTAISLYGGFFSTMPSYLKTLYSNKYLSTIHGRILFCWGISGLCTPTLLSLCKDITGVYTPMFYVFVIMMLINLFILYKIRKDVISRDGDFIHEILND